VAQQLANGVGKPAQLVGVHLDAPQFLQSSKTMGQLLETIGAEVQNFELGQVAEFRRQNLFKEYQQQCNKQRIFISIDNS
jgi:hypothetical protein